MESDERVLVVTDFDEGAGEALIRQGFDLAETAASVVTEILDAEKCPFPSEVSLTVTDDEGIRQVNREARGIDRPTDVLSFPVFQYEVPGHFQEAEADRAGCFDPENGRLLLGDILINADAVLRQAGEYGHSVKREFSFLTAHSTLHLIGYDHMTPEEEEIMCKKQEASLQILGIGR